jgi:hypothetical protein
MSANLAEDFMNDPSVSYLPEESWEETIHPLQKGQDRERGRRSKRHFDAELSTKKYRLVFNHETAAVRLEGEEGLAAERVAESHPDIDSRITEAIETSRYILAYEDNWDDEGSLGYQEATWLRATNFIKEASISYQKVCGTWAAPPRILPGPDGSIDIHWKTPIREVLINVPANDETLAGYYGSSNSNITIKGKLDPSAQNLWLLAWLLQ